ncbi:MAG: glycosyltransferase family 39 protein [Candidatus Saccharibacteria bacterium]|nr:glycosyltransferase family 39 protein [Candidatus Saccharibacteria bacterium]
MNMHTLSTLFLYRWRYVISYIGLVIALLTAITIALLYAPGGLTQAEIDGLATTQHLASGTIAIPNLPLHGLQAAFFSLFGVSTFTIKLPAAIFAISSVIAMFFLLRRWFKPGIATLSLTLMVITGQFIYIAQSFTPGIMYIFWSTLILLFGSLIAQKAKRSTVWKVALALSMGLSLSTPYFWYINLGILLVGLIHPHTRHLLLARKYRLSWLPAIIAFAIATAPLAYLCTTQPSLLQALLGLGALSIPTFDGAMLLIRAFLWPAPTVAHGQLMPVIDMGAMALIILGIAASIRQWHTARSYVIIAWLPLVLPLILLIPEALGIATIPMFILLAVGLETLLNEWYKLFPKNPYARGTGLLLTVILLGIMMLSGVNRYIKSYHYNPTAITAHSVDLQLLQSDLRQHDAATIVTADSERPLYEALARYTKKSLTIANSADGAVKDMPLYITRAARKPDDAPKQRHLARIIVNARATDADRFYYYK